MGKSLKGKECGKGICKRKDGQYYARFVDKRGKRKESYFSTLPEARNWLEDAPYAGLNITMGTMLKSALMNDLIVKHPINGVRYTKPARAAKATWSCKH